ncbi:MFS drug efflux transporter [Lindgomyces ingoldianus]|uniref:MFS drug efflux transporter n=1 Tax=Lindgomyces ingoldianus TaxID=673940 RepID=A0ACB6RFX4_9PLEO|nr:MFS drug efflux transporter [Lindgomyces ingoldianus]KAF2477217.1 MFS drug efflux transporter [Lindgomyces ingoldianus]
MPRDEVSGEEPSVEPTTEPTAEPAAEPGVEATALPSSSPRRWLFWILMVLAILSTVFLFALDNTITANLIPPITERFGQADKIPWLSVAFMMGGLSVVLPFGRLYALFDAKILYITMVTLFLAGSALCGGAPNIDVFIFGRVLAGFGGIGMYLGVMTLLSVNTNPTERPMYLGLVGLVFGIGNVVGPLIGGAFADSSATWRWSFYLNLCIMGVLSPVYFFMIPSFQPQKDRSVASRLADIDLLGSVLSIGALVCLIMGINFGGTLYGWGSGQIISLFILSGVLFLAFAIQQYFAFLTTESDRLFPVAFLGDKEALLLFFLTATFNASGFIPIYWIPSYFQFTRGDGPLDSAIRLLPLIVFITFLVIVNGGALSKGGYYMPWFLAGSIIILPAGVLFSRVDSKTSTAEIYGYEVLLGFGAGMGMQAGFAVIQSITKPEVMAHGVAFIMIAQLLGVSLALSISGAVFVNKALSGLQKLLAGHSREQILRALQGLSGNFLTTLTDQQRHDTLAIIVKCLSKVYILVYTAAHTLILVTY